MGALQTANQVVHEDLSDVLKVADERMTPVSSRILQKKGKKLKAMDFSWPVEKMANRKTDPPPENKDVTEFEGGERTKLRNRAQKYWRTPRVTTEAQEVNDAAGVENEYNHQIAKYVKEEKRDIETTWLSDQESNEDNGIVGSRTKGLGRIINDGTLAFTDTLTTIPAGYRTPAAQIYTGLLADFDEAALTTMMQNRRQLFGASGEFVLYVATALKRQISDNFGRYVPDKVGSTVVVQTQRAAIDKKRLITAGIDVFEGDFGTVEVEIADWMPTTGRGYGLDLDEFTARPLKMCEHLPLPFLGGGKSGLIESILSFEFGDPRKQLKIAPSDEVTADLSGT